MSNKLSWYHNPLKHIWRWSFFFKKTLGKAASPFFSWAAPVRKLLTGTEKGKEKSTSCSTCSMQCPAVHFGKACCLCSPQELNSLREVLGAPALEEWKLTGAAFGFSSGTGHAEGSQGAARDTPHCWSHLPVLPQFLIHPRQAMKLCSPLESGTQAQKGVLPFGTYRCHNPALTRSLPCSDTNNVSQPIKQWVMTQL